MREFAVGQFHNSFQLPSDVRRRMVQMRMLENIRQVEGLFGHQRKYLREIGWAEEEKGRMRTALLAYGHDDKEFSEKIEGLKAEHRLEEVTKHIELSLL